MREARVSLNARDQVSFGPVVRRTIRAIVRARKPDPLPLENAINRATVCGLLLASLGGRLSGEGPGLRHPVVLTARKPAATSLEGLLKSLGLKSVRQMMIF